LSKVKHLILVSQFSFHFIHLTL